MDTSQIHPVNLSSLSPDIYSAWVHSDNVSLSLFLLLHTRKNCEQQDQIHADSSAKLHKKLTNKSTHTKI